MKTRLHRNVMSDEQGFYMHDYLVEFTRVEF